MAYQIITLRTPQRDSAFFVDNLLVRIHFIIEMIWRTGLAPWEFDFCFRFTLKTPRRSRWDVGASTSEQRYKNLIYFKEFYLKAKATPQNCESESDKGSDKEKERERGNERETERQTKGKRAFHAAHPPEMREKVRKRARASE